MKQHAFDAAIALARQDDGTWQGHTSPAYANFIGPFGGVTAAQALNAVLLHPERLGEPVAFTINYAAALADGPFVVDAKPARTNRSTQHWQVELRQGDEVIITATAMTAVRRPTWGAVEHPMPDVPRPTDVPVAKGRRVEWTERYEMRFIDGFIPRTWDGSDSGGTLTRMWFRDQQPRPLDFASLVAMCDIFFPRLWGRRASQTPLGTVSMTVYFHADDARLSAAGTGYLLGQARAHAIFDGYADQDAQLWSEDGVLLATTHQLMYFKE